MVRILFQNPQGLGKLGNQSVKLNKLKDKLPKHNVYIVGFAETNKDWRGLQQRETFWACTEGWFQYRRLTTGISPLCGRSDGGSLQ
jgi:hypothetical protein